MKIISEYKELVAIQLYDIEEESLQDVNQGHEFFKSQKLDIALKKYESAIKKMSKRSYSAILKSKIYYAYGLALGYSGLSKKGEENMDTAYNLYADERYKTAKKLMIYYTNQNNGYEEARNCESK